MSRTFAAIPYSTLKPLQRSLFLTDIAIVAAFGVCGFFGHCPDGRRSVLNLRAPPIL
jgi:hypothetical protein